MKEPGIYRDCDVAAYHADPCPEPSLSQSIAKVLIDYSPLHAKAKHPRLTTPELESADVEKYIKAKVIGDAAHALMIGRGKTLAMGFYDDWKTRAAKEFRDGAIADGKTPILEAHFSQAYSIVQAARSQFQQHQEVDCFLNGAGEVALIWQEGPLWFRCLVDWLHNDLLTVDDYKTTGMSVAPHGLGYRAVDAGWDVQAAMIERGLDVLDPNNAGRRKIRFIPQEQDAPYCLNVMVMDEHWLTMGRKKLQHAIGIWSNCMAHKKWPGYPPYAVTPEYPGFKETQWLNREIAAEESASRNINPNLLMAG